MLIQTLIKQLDEKDTLLSFSLKMADLHLNIEKSGPLTRSGYFHIRWRKAAAGAQQGLKLAARRETFLW